MILLPLLCLLSPGFGPASAQDTKPNNMVTVSEGKDALLPCTLSSGQNFDWRKDNEKSGKPEHDVFTYVNGETYGENLTGQSQQFKTRVDFFDDEVKSGNASIKIRNTRLDDSGTYTCLKINSNGATPVVKIILHVDGVLKIRTVVGAAPMPYIQTIEDEGTWRLLECKAEGVPEPKVVWENSTRSVLEKHVPNSQSRSLSVDLRLNVTKSDTYTCVVTQTTIYHQINNSLKVNIVKNTSSGVVIAATLVPTVVFSIIAVFFGIVTEM